MKKTNRFLSLIIIIFSIVAFRPSPYISNELSSNQVTIYESEDFKLSVDQEYTSIFRGVLLNDSDKSIRISASEEISSVQTKNSNLKEAVKRSTSNYIITIEPNGIVKGNYLLDIQFCDLPKDVRLEYNRK